MPLRPGRGKRTLPPPPPPPPPPLRHLRPRPLPPRLRFPLFFSASARLPVTAPIAAGMPPNPSPRALPRLAPDPSRPLSLSSHQTLHLPPPRSRRRRLARTARSDLGRGPLPARRGHPTREGRRALHGRGRAQAVVPTATWPRAGAQHAHTLRASASPSRLPPAPPTPAAPYHPCLSPTQRAQPASECVQHEHAAPACLTQREGLPLAAVGEASLNPARLTPTARLQSMRAASPSFASSRRTPSPSPKPHAPASPLPDAKRLASRHSDTARRLFTELRWPPSRRSSASPNKGQQAHSH